MTRPCKRRKVKNPSGKVSRRLHKSVVKKTIIHDCTVGRFWDMQKTIEQNFATVGLVSRVNDDLCKSEVRKRLENWQNERFQKLVETGEANMKAVEELGEQAIFMRPMLNEEEVFSKLEDLFQQQSVENEIKQIVHSELEERCKQVEARKSQGLSEFEWSYIERLVQKYGDNYKKMSLDHKINSRQLTARQLELMAEQL